MDYNKLMEELDREVKGSFESTSVPGLKSAIEGYDEVENDLMASLEEKKPIVEVDGEEDLVFGDDQPQDEEDSPEDPKEALGRAIEGYLNSLLEEGLDKDEASDEVLELVNSFLPQDEDGSVEEPAEEDLGSWLAARKLRKMNRKGISDDATDEDKAAFKDKQERLKLRARAGAIKGDNPNATQKVLDEVRKEGQQRNAQRTNEIKAKKAREALRADLMSKLGLPTIDKLKEVLGKAGFSATEGFNSFESGETVEVVTEDNYTEDSEKQKEILNNTVKEISDEMDLNKAIDSATESTSSFEEYQKDKESKMLKRYKQLANKDEEKRKVAIEGLGELDISIDDRAISRVSGEYGYSGKNLKKMVAEAIQRGEI